MPQQIDVCMVVGALSPRLASYSSVNEGIREFGDFVGSAPPFTALEIGVLKLDHEPSEFFDILLDIGFSVTVLNPEALEQFARSIGEQGVTASSIVRYLRPGRGGNGR